MYKTYVALEPIKNYTICVVKNDGIRNLKYQSDITESLVYVNNRAKSDGDDVLIDKNGLCRAINILVFPQFNINEL